MIGYIMVIGGIYVIIQYFITVAWLLAGNPKRPKFRYPHPTRGNHE